MTEILYHKNARYALFISLLKKIYIISIVYIIIVVHHR